MDLLEPKTPPSMPPSSLSKQQHEMCCSLPKCPSKTLKSPLIDDLNEHGINELNLSLNEEQTNNHNNVCQIQYQPGLFGQNNFNNNYTADDNNCNANHDDAQTESFSYSSFLSFKTISDLSSKVIDNYSSLSIPKLSVNNYHLYYSNYKYCNGKMIMNYNYNHQPLTTLKMIITAMIILISCTNNKWPLMSRTSLMVNAMDLLPRPIPFAADYRPECDLIFPASLTSYTEEELHGPMEPHPSLQPQVPQSFYFPSATNQEMFITPAGGDADHYENFLTATQNRYSAAGNQLAMNPMYQKYFMSKSSSYIPGGHICITYKDIDQAVIEAKMQLGLFHLPFENNQLSSDYPKTQHVAKVGELLTKASEILAKMYGLNKELIVYGLPRIDTTNTLIRDICPAFLKPVKCQHSKYRTLSGMCNNLEYPSWGSTRSAMLRYLPPDYADGLTAPRVAKNGQSLPSPRVVSFVLHQDDNDYDHEITYLVVAWGQMVDHDLTFASMPKDNNDKSVKCCKYPPQQWHPSCYPIQVPNNDPYYKFYPKKCMDFVRSVAGVKTNCPLGPRHQINVVSSFLDADIIYGHTLSTAKRLRTFNGGKLKSTKLYRNIGLKDLLPMKTQNPDQGCERSGHGLNSYCFDTGDDRSNVQLQLTVLHTIWLRHHNQIAEVLSQINPHWSDEQLYQEARKIVGAMIQHITYNEFLPIVVGRHAMNKFGLNLVKYGYYHGYDPKINPGVRVEFQAAAFRFGHSIVPDTVDRYNKFHQKLEELRLSSLLRQPFSLYHPGVLDTFLLGLINQPAYRVDATLANEMTNHLFQKPGEQFGLDMAAINILRGREMGVPGYNYIREYCGLPRLKHFSDLYGLIQNNTIRRYMELYDNVDDIDFWSAGISEYPLEGAMVGPTFACIISEQFVQLRKGDRFWYENGHGYTKFTLEQLTELRKVKLARILCEAADDIETIQLYPLLTAHATSNPRVNCEELPELDLSPWRDAYLYPAGAAAAATAKSA